MDESKFRETEKKYNDLKDKLGRGQLSAEQVKAELKTLMVQDENGKYWMMGGKSGKWYAHDGTQWQEADPYEKALEDENESPLLDTASFAASIQDSIGEPAASGSQSDAQFQQQSGGQGTGLQDEQEEDESVFQGSDAGEKSVDTGGFTTVQKDSTIDTDGETQADDYSHPIGTNDHAVEFEQAYDNEISIGYETGGDQDKAAADKEGAALEVDSGRIDDNDYSVNLGPSDQDFGGLDPTLDATSQADESTVTKGYDDKLETHEDHDTAKAYTLETYDTVTGQEGTGDSPDTQEVRSQMPTQEEHPVREQDLAPAAPDQVFCKMCKSRIPAYAVYCNFCGANQKDSEAKTKAADRFTPQMESELLIKSVKITSLLFFLGGLGLIVGVIFGAVFGILKDFLPLVSSQLPMMLSETRGGIAGGLIFAAIGGIGGFVVSAINAVFISLVYNGISFIFGGVRFKIKR